MTRSDIVHFKRTEDRQDRFIPVWKRDQARSLRKNQTDAENRLWFIVRGKRLGVKFRRQQVIGPYIADFYCSELKLVIEADGGQHGGPTDQERDAFLTHEGMTVLRLWNNDILQNPDGVFRSIENMVQKIRLQRGII